VQGLADQAAVQGVEEKNQPRQRAEAQMVPRHRLESKDGLRQQQERLAAIQAEEAEHQRALVLICNIFALLLLAAVLTTIYQELEPYSLKLNQLQRFDSYQRIHLLINSIFFDFYKIVSYVYNTSYSINFREQFYSVIFILTLLYRH
jgi:hypothetical protein